VRREKLLTQNLDVKTLRASLAGTLQAWQLVGEQLTSQHCHDKTFLVYLKGQSEPAPTNAPVGHSVHWSGLHIFIQLQSVNYSWFLTYKFCFGAVFLPQH